MMKAPPWSTATSASASARASAASVAFSAMVACRRQIAAEMPRALALTCGGWWFRCNLLAVGEKSWLG